MIVHYLWYVMRVMWVIMRERKDWDGEFENDEILVEPEFDEIIIYPECKELGLGDKSRWNGHWFLCKLKPGGPKKVTRPYVKYQFQHEYDVIHILTAGRVKTWRQEREHVGYKLSTLLPRRLHVIPAPDKSNFRY